MPYSRAIDIWSLGAICFELIIGRDLLLDEPLLKLSEDADDVYVETNHADALVNETDYRRYVRTVLANRCCVAVLTRCIFSVVM